MQVSYKWLQRYVDITISPEALAEKLTMAGITVDLVHHPWAGIDGLVVGKVLTCEQHPNADKLHVCTVDVGQAEPLQIVCGAPNVAAGLKVIVAMIGAHLPGGKISKGKLRGVESFGMLCSLAELNVDTSPEAASGIHILPDEVAVGADVVELLMLDDAVLELDLTPNRSDCLSVLNVAREVAAVTGAEFHLPVIQYQENGESVADYAKITVEDDTLCPRYTARMIKNVTMGQSPMWMQHFLLTAGMRPINNVVDISNFVLLEYGQPLHTFDYDTLVGHEVVVRPSVPGESIVTLDQQHRDLPEHTILICDGEKPVCIGGVMGGLNSEITKETKNILLEAAAFEGVSIRHTSRDLGLRSEASMRYEKGVDVMNVDAASRRAVQLLVELCGAEAVGGVLDSCPDCNQDKKVLLDPAFVNQVLGTDFAEEDMVKAIASLDFAMEKVDGGYLVDIPSYRQDIALPVDLVEEVVRLLGFDHVPASLPCGEMTEGRRTPKQSFQEAVVNAAVSVGLKQIVTYSFISPKDWDALQLPAGHPWRENVQIMNPLTEEQSVMRTTLLPGLLQTAGRNHSRRNLDLALFEQGSVFVPTGEALPEEPVQFAALVSGHDFAGWYGGGQEMDFFYLKGLLDGVFQKLGIKGWHLEATTVYPFLHPGRAAQVFIGEEAVGLIGEVHPTVAKTYGLSGRAVVWELDVAAMMDGRAVSSVHSLPKFPASSRDIALVAPVTLEAAKIDQVIVGAGGKYLKKVQLFDVYQGAQVAEGCRSLAYGLTFQAADRTLTDEEVNKAFDKILAALKEQLGVELR